MTTPDLRNRAKANFRNTMSSDNESENFIHSSGRGLAAKSMIDSSPQQHGVVLKLHVPILYSILPEFFQRIILSISFLSFLGPTWKQRYLILCGSFLYKFKNNAAEVPKGCPFALETVNVDTVSEGMPEFGSLPPEYTSIFSVSTMRRQHYYAVADIDEARVWIRSIRQERQETITRNMGHAASKPYPKAWSYFDSLGRGLVRSKERIRDKMVEYNMREMEMSSFVDTGPMPRFHA